MDIERCPYVPKDPEYAEWNRKNDERLEAILAARRKLKVDAHSYLSHNDRTVRDMAIFITAFLKE